MTPQQSPNPYQECKLVGGSTYTFPGEPIPKGRPRSTRSGHTYTPARTKQAEDAIRWELIAGCAKPIVGPVQVALYFHCKSKTADLDNLVKLCLDACQKPKGSTARTGYLWENDRQVCRIVAEVERGSSEPETRLVVSAYDGTLHEQLQRITEIGQEIENQRGTAA